MRQTILIFSCLSVAILLLFELSKLSLMSPKGINDIYIVISGGLFIAIGFLINRLMHKDVSKTNRIGAIEVLPTKTDLSKQEHRVLILMANGLSNIEIAESLFISESTVKTHVSRILSKLRAKRRTEAIKIGRDLNII
ncbi:LuxR C-terminal-related transcriptional regulator [Fulvivirgaceae bacterium BMA10]|uniref:LuxR C-terminal-related transcriptional regulator n=1 Tax=Splendidivirga corallicola TaxID=3051826 RepID=A0ABT8KPK2_9BACT|nr:LuxR C-terminal-related transcriptional regulator [Fulvivirgaceae bacterium BMA10]